MIVVKTMCMRDRLVVGLDIPLKGLQNRGGAGLNLSAKMDSEALAFSTYT